MRERERERDRELSLEEKQRFQTSILQSSFRSLEIAFIASQLVYIPIQTTALFLREDILSKNWPSRESSTLRYDAKFHVERFN